MVVAVTQDERKAAACIPHGLGGEMGVFRQPPSQAELPEILKGIFGENTKKWMQPGILMLVVFLVVRKSGMRRVFPR
jgi:hypothetical protein